MTRFFCTLAVSSAALFLVFLLVRPTVAQTPSQEAQQDSQPNGTPKPGAAAVDWAGVHMESAGDFPHAPDPDTDTPQPPDDRTLAPDETSELTAPSVETMAATPTSSEITYVVQPGDTLYEIAQRFGISLADLIVANNIQNSRRLEIGQLLNITHPDSSVPATAAPPRASGNSYVVQRGDSPYEIAQRFGVSVDVLMTVNQIADPRRLVIGQVLIVPQNGAVPVVAATPVPTPLPVVAPAAVPIGGAPAAPGSAGIYVVQRGDTLYHIARNFGITIQALIEANSLVNPNRIMTGQILTIPGTSAKSPPESTPQPQPETQPAPSPTQPSTVENLQPPVGDTGFAWPISLRDGWIAKWYRPEHPGIDIILPEGTPIRAAAAGTVEFSGWNSHGFGHLVVLDHGNGYRTLYAHQSERLVASGEAVAEGDVIGLVGGTGDSTHMHLHFEIRRGYTPVNPCDFLANGCQP